MRATVTIAGAALCAALSGASASLVVVSPLVLAAMAFVLCALAVRSRIPVRDCALSLALGSSLALTLPTSPPTVAGDVLTRSVRGGSGDLFELLERIDRDPRSVLGSRVSVSGAWTPAHAGRPSTVSRRVMTCCAADAIAVGYDVMPASTIALPAGAQVRVWGTLTSRLDAGEVRYELIRARVKAQKS